MLLEVSSDSHDYHSISQSITMITQQEGKWQSSIIFAPYGTQNQRHLVGEEPVH